MSTLTMTLPTWLLALVTVMIAVTSVFSWLSLRLQRQIKKIDLEIDQTQQDVVTRLEKLRAERTKS